MVEAGAIRVLGDTEAARGIALGIGVDDEDSEVVGGEGSGEVDSGGRLADAALLIRNCKNPAQAVILPRSSPGLKPLFHVKQ